MWLVLVGESGDAGYGTAMRPFGAKRKCGHRDGRPVLDRWIDAIGAARCAEALIAIGGRLLGPRLLSRAMLCAPFRGLGRSRRHWNLAASRPGDFALATWKARSSNTRPVPCIRELGHPIRVSTCMSPQNAGVACSLQRYRSRRSPRQQIRAAADAGRSRRVLGSRNSERQPMLSAGCQRQMESVRFRASSSWPHSLFATNC